IEDFHGNPHPSKSNKGPWVLVLPKFGRSFLFIILNPVFWWLLDILSKRKSHPLTVPLPEPQSYAPPPSPKLIVPAFSDEPPPIAFSPTLVIGLGGAGRWVLTHFKKALLDAC